jgi:hypothetical protein
METRYAYTISFEIFEEIASDTKTSEKDNIEMDLMEVLYENEPLAGV